MNVSSLIDQEHIYFFNNNTKTLYRAHLLFLIAEKVVKVQHWTLYFLSESYFHSNKHNNLNVYQYEY